MDVHVWCHLNCALWSTEVFERMNGALMNVETAFKRSLSVECCGCLRKGASLKCFSPKCASHYHLACGIKHKCVFYQDKVSGFKILILIIIIIFLFKTLYCQLHAPKLLTEGVLSDLSVFRKVWIERNDVSQIQRYFEIKVK